MKSLSPAVVALWFASLALVSATKFYAVYGHYTMESYLGFYLLPLLATFLCTHMLYRRFVPASIGQALRFGATVAVAAVLLAVAIYSVVLGLFISMAGRSSFQPSLLDGAITGGSSFLYTFFTLLMRYYSDLIQAIGLGLVDGIGLWSG